MLKALAIIPARYASQRFPGKPLTLIAGKPMLQHVYENVSASGLFQDVVVATDDERIYEACEGFEAKVIMTSPKHASGTDRCAEAANIQGESFDVVVNIQGDEPFVTAEPLKEILKMFSFRDVQIATLVQRIKTEAELANPSIVKVVRNRLGKALYFSRAAIPYIREKSSDNWFDSHIYWKHIGIYAFRSGILQKVVKLPVSSLEQAESLEQLRWLEAGYNIYTSETSYRMISVDTIEDRDKAEKYFLNLKAK